MICRILRWFTLLVLLWHVQSCAKKDNNQKLTIAAASNLQFVLPEIVENFQEETGIACNLIFGSSGKLTAQIKKGAQYHVFLSADSHYPEYLFNEGLASQSPRQYALGHLVLFAKDSTLLTLSNWSSNQKLALANPKFAPYGKAAQEFLDLKGLVKKDGDFLVYGENVSQVNQFVMTGAASMALSSKSAILALAKKESIFWKEIEPDQYNPIEQAAVIINQDNMQKEADRFLNFLFHTNTQSTLSKNGYQSVNE